MAEIRELSSFTVEEKAAVFDRLFEMSKRHFDQTLAGDQDDDMEHYIFEEVFEGCLGREVWGPFNKAVR